MLSSQKEVLQQRMKCCCYQSDYSNEKITWLEKEGATQLKIIMHSGADHNGDFGKITENIVLKAQ